MNEILKETFGTQNTEEQTPIEIALGVDAQGMTTATKLYEFLELNPTNYSKWFKKNIIENQFAEEEVDYFRFVLKYESGDDFIKERQDAHLTASFAKKLSMTSKSRKGEAARNYFVGVENGTKKLVKNISPQQIPIGEIASYIKAMDKVFVRQQLAPCKIAEAFVMISEQFGIQLPEGCVKVPEYEQMKLSLF